MKRLNINIFTLLALFVIGSIFTNCNGNKNLIEDPASENLMGVYKITTLNESRLSADTEISFEISEFNKSIRGATVCNSFFGTFAKEGHNIRVTEMNISENYCDAVVMKSEQNLLGALRTVGSYILIEGKLTLYSDSDKRVLIIAVKDTIQ